MSDSESSLGNFQGTARLFPLPNLVYFPRAVQPLHIFEPRYRQMTADALAGDRLIAIVLLQPDWEKNYDGKPAVYSVGCLGRILADQKLDDGRYNLLLRGLHRVRITREIANGKIYRSAEVQLIEDIVPTLATEAELRQRVRNDLGNWLSAKGGGYQELMSVAASDIPLGGLADLLTFMLPLSHQFKQSQLEETDVSKRVERLLEAVLTPSPTASPQRCKYPRDFSPN